MNRRRREGRREGEKEERKEGRKRNNVEWNCGRTKRCSSITLSACKKYLIV